MSVTSVTFPLVLTGDYTDGSVCAASDYRADFEMLRDAVNSMHERFNTMIFTGADITYQAKGKSYAPAWGDTQASSGAFGVGGGGAGSGDGNDYKILNIIEIPAWMQGVRVRELEICNFSRIPNEEGAAWNGGSGQVVYTPNASKPLKLGVAFGSGLSAFAPDNWTATDIASVSLDSDAKIRGPYQYHASANGLNTDSVFASGTGYGSSSAFRAVPAGNYLAIYATGLVDFKVSGSHVEMFDLNWHFMVNVLCDTMIPIT